MDSERTRADPPLVISSLLLWRWSRCRSQIWIICVRCGRRRATLAIDDRQAHRCLARHKRARCSDKGGTGNCLVHDRLCASLATCQPRGPSPAWSRRSGVADAFSHENWTGPLSGEGASRPRSRARATVSARRCVPSLAYMWRMCVLTVLCETDSSFAISGMDRLVGR